MTRIKDLYGTTKAVPFQNMNAIARLFKKLSLLVRREKFASELDEEMAFHREQAERELAEDGVDPEAAHYAVVKQFGNATRLKEDSVETVGFGFESVLRDLRYAARQLRHNPGFTATAMLVLAIGVGATTAIFSAVNPILFKALPYPEASRVAMIWETRDKGAQMDVTFGSFHGVSERQRSFETLAVMKPWQPSIAGDAQPERFEGQRVSSEYFRVLGILPALGRGFETADDQYKGPNVAILSDRLWRRRFGADGSIVGRQVKLDDNLFTVVGVMPASFENVLAPTAEIWAPLQYNPALPLDSREWGHHLRMIGRLRDGVSLEQATSELDVILHTLGQIYAKGYDGSGGVPDAFIVNSMQSDVTRGVKSALLAVLGAVMLVLVIACVNVTSLLLARGAQRRGEFAVRVALGASRGRLMRQLLLESLLLTALGGALGMLVAEGGVRALVALSPAGLPRVEAIRLDGVAFLFGLGIAMVIGLAVGMVPALQASRRDPQSELQQGSRRTAGGHHITRRVLVVSEVALALVLLVSAGLLLRSLQRLFAIDPGFDGSHMLTMQVQEYGHRYDKDAVRDRFFTQALDAVRQVPGVTEAAFTSQLPLSGDYESYGAEFESKPGENFGAALRYAVSPQYFEAMRIPLRRGRLLEATDTTGAPLAVVVSESFAKAKLAGQDPIGKRIRVGPSIGHADQPWNTIVGVVGDVKQASLALDESEAFYTTRTQWPWVDNVQSLVVRTRGDAAALAPAIRSAIWSVDKDQPIVRVATMENLLAASEAERRFALILFAAFAIVALMLAGTGIYGVLAGSVAERTREIGVRAALGASRTDILTLVIRQGMLLAAIGIAIGLVGAAAASQAVASLLYGVSRLDPVTYVGVIVLLGGVALAACGVPAWRAAKVDPATTLRAE
jgi:putative ABC transport system permease protein